jgi:hypothetical protein
MFAQRRSSGVFALLLFVNSMKSILSDDLKIYRTYGKTVEGMKCEFHVYLQVSLNRIFVPINIQRVRAIP